MVDGIVQFGSGSLKQLPRHRNEGLEIVYVSKGQLRWEVEGQEELVTPGSVYFTLPWQEHGSAQEFEPGHEWHFIVLALERNEPPADGILRFHPALGFRAEEAAELGRTLLEENRHTHVATANLTWLLPRLVAELKSNQLGGGVFARALAVSSVVELVRSIRSGQTQRYSLSGRRVTRLLEDLRKAPEEDWTLDGMASRCKLKRTQFAHVFSLLTGETPMEHVTRLRLEKARKLLLSTKRSITEIAHECGFSSSQYFAKVFRKHEGMEASAFRKRG